MKQTVILFLVFFSLQIQAQTENLFSKVYTNIEDTQITRFSKVVYWEAENAVIVMAHGRRNVPRALLKFDMSGELLDLYHIPTNNNNTDFLIIEDRVYLIAQYSKWVSPHMLDSVDIRMLNTSLEVEWVNRYEHFLPADAEMVVIGLSHAGGDKIQAFIRYPFPMTASYIHQYPGSGSILNAYHLVELDTEGIITDHTYYPVLSTLGTNLNEVYFTDDTMYSVGHNYSDAFHYGRKYIIDEELPVQSTDIRTDVFSNFLYSIKPVHEAGFFTTGYHTSSHISGRSYAYLEMFDSELNTVFKMDSIGIYDGQSRLYNSFSGSEKIYAVGQLNMSADDNLKQQLYAVSEEGGFEFSRFMNHSEETRDGELYSGLQLPDGRLVLTGRVEDITLGRKVGWILFTNDTGCIQEDCYYPLPPTSTDQVDAESGFSIYPNPGNDGVFFITIDHSGAKNTEIEVFDVIGQSVYRSVCDFSFIQIDISHCMKGVYFISVNTEQGRSVKKIIYQ